jgi:hypothetical protein
MNRLVDLIHEADGDSYFTNITINMIVTTSRTLIKSTAYKIKWKKVYPHLHLPLPQSSICLLQHLQLSYAFSYEWR